VHFCTIPPFLYFYNITRPNCHLLSSVINDTIITSRERNLKVNTRRRGMHSNPAPIAPSRVTRRRKPRTATCTANKFPRRRECFFPRQSSPRDRADAPANRVIPRQRDGAGTGASEIVINARVTRDLIQNPAPRPSLLPRLFYQFNEGAT